MLRSSLTAVIFVLSLSIQAQVVPNGGFETWISTPQFTLDPAFWQTDNNQLQLSTSQDSLPYEGQWGMKVEPLPTGVGEEGYARIEIPTTAIPPSLDFHVKYDRTETCGIGVNIDFYNGDTWFYGEGWYPQDLNSEWTPVSIELDQIEPIMTHAIISVWVVVGDLLPGEGWISVDAMSFDGATGVDDIETSELRVYPNPTADMLYLEDAGSNAIYTIYDSTGRLLSSDMYQLGIDVSTFSAGNYFIEINTAEGILRRTGFVVEL